MAAPSDQRYPSFTSYLKHAVAPCTANHGHVSSKWLVLMLWQRLFKLSAPIGCYNIK